MVNSAGPSCDRVGRDREKPGPAQLELWNLWVGHGLDFLIPTH